MFKFIFIVVVTLVIINFTSDIKIQGSLYKSEDNVFSIQFPKAEWRKEPIFYMHCQPEKGSTESTCGFNKEATDGDEKLEHFQGF